MHAKIAAFALAAVAALHAQAAGAMPAQQPPGQTPKVPPTMHANTHTVSSRYAFAETLQRLQDAVRAKGMTVFAVIDHQAAAQANGLHMQPATVVVFGTPKAGTPLMVKDPSFALQLPLRVLVTEVNGQVQVVFNDTRALISDSKIDYADVANSLANAETLIRKTVSE